MDQLGVEVVCPSGMRGRLRPLKVIEEKQYRDLKARKQNKIIENFIKMGWVKLEDPGPYDFANQVEWPKLLQGDVLWLLFQTRALTYGTDYTLEIPCQFCGKVSPLEIDILNDLSAQQLPDPSKQHVKTGVPLEVTWEGVNVSFRLLRLGDEAKVGRVEEGREIERSYAALAVSLLAVGEIEHEMELIRWVEELSAGEAQDLIFLMDQHGCGIDTSIKFPCPACYRDQRLDLPLEAGFWRRSNKRRSKTQKAAEIRTM